MYMYITWKCYPDTITCLLNLIGIIISQKQIRPPWKNCLFATAYSEVRFKKRVGRTFFPHNSKLVAKFVQLMNKLSRVMRKLFFFLHMRKQTRRSALR